MKNLLKNITQRTEMMWNELLNKKGNNWALVVNGLGEVELLNGRYTGEVLAKGNRNIQKLIRELMNK